MFIFLSLQILAAHFDDLQAGRLNHSFFSVNVLATATALPYRSNHRLLMISPYRYSSARVCAGESNGSPRRNPISLTFNSMKGEWRQGAALQSFERVAGAGYRSCPLTAACAKYVRF
jgi:hypothetical protein